MLFDLRNRNQYDKAIREEFEYILSQLSIQFENLFDAQGNIEPTAGVSNVYRDIFHGDVNFGTDEVGDKPSTFTLEDPETGERPTDKDEVLLWFHGPHTDPNNVNKQISARVTSHNQVTFNKSGSAPAVTSVHYFTVAWVRR